MLSHRSALHAVVLESRVFYLERRLHEMTAHLTCNVTQQSHVVSHTSMAMLLANHSHAIQSTVQVKHPVFRNSALHSVAWKVGCSIWRADYME